ncbi:MAG TPA: hypothetical protein VMX97_14320 [Hyphomicrobiaceae bacterium]|nr:hypothetical protein [Hyphomicrobiaceae bacterium]
MATIDTAAAWNVRSHFARAAFAALLAAGLAGCSTGGTTLLTDQSTVAKAPAAQPTAQQRGKIAIAPIIGAPDNVARQISARLAQSVAQKGIAVAQSPAEKSDYTLRGYIVAAREASGTKVSYIWDVTNPAGHRVNRITGEEMIRGAGSGDPWASVSPNIIGNLSDRTATSLAAWMPRQAAPAQPASVPVADAQGRGAGASPVRTAAVPQALPPPATTASTSGSQSAQVQAIVPRVTGAPGDGSIALARALQKELTRNGIALSTAGGATVYKVEGQVAIGPGNAGKQPIQIDWIVKDPKGQKLGTVSQKNEIPAGSLNGKWGATADAAAAAAAQGILRLLPKSAGG